MQLKCLNYCLLWLLLVSAVRSNIESDTSEKPDDYYYDDDLDEFAITKPTDHYMHDRSQESVTLTNVLVSTPVSTSTAKISATPIATTKTLSVIESKCPTTCFCSNDLKSINCTRRQLTEIPINLPPIATKIDLSHNQLTQLNVTNLEYCTNLSELLLNNNQIGSISNKEAFAKLQHLDHIDLSSNALKPLNGDEFSDAKKLSNLSIAHNWNIVTENIQLLNNSNLKHLDLSDCNITEFSHNTFNALTSLLSLKLQNNTFNSDINVRAFQPLVNLRSLQLPNVTQNEVKDLCVTLTAIDLINFDSFAVSCFELVSGTSFDESIFKTRQTDQVVIPDYYDEDEQRYIHKIITTEEAIITLTTITTTIAPVETVSESVVHEPKLYNSNEQNDIFDNTTLSRQANVTDTKEDTSRVHISSQSINNILIGIIILSLVGLLIGIICRIDCCGIKTKACRRRRRQEPTDQVRPAEEVPLNKI